MIARTVRLDRDVDLLAVAGARRVSVRGARRRSRRSRRRGARSLRVRRKRPSQPSPTEDEVGLPGCGPVAFAALPFTLTPQAELIVPEVVVGRTADGTRWVTTIGPMGALDARHRCRRQRPHDRAGPPTLASPPPETRPTGKRQSSPRATRSGPARSTRWCSRASCASRCPSDIDVVGVLARLRSSFPSSFVYSVDGMIGASPELLVSRSGDVVRSHPLAGTAPRSGDPAVDARIANALMASTKDQLEHRLTIDMVHDTLLPWCSYLDEEAEPSIVAVANVQHLGTLVEGRLSKPLPSVLDLVQALHPTPAVGGHPRADALALIDELEELDRGRYAGPVGWVDARRQRAVGGRAAVRRDRRSDGPPLRRRGRGPRLRSRCGAGRDPSQVRRHAQCVAEAVISRRRSPLRFDRRRSLRSTIGASRTRAAHCAAHHSTSPSSAALPPAPAHFVRQSVLRAPGRRTAPPVTPRRRRPLRFRRLLLTSFDNRCCAHPGGALRRPSTECVDHRAVELVVHVHVLGAVGADAHHPHA